MSRNKLSDKKVNRISKKTGLDISHIFTRGGTDHRKDLHLTDGRIIYLWPDGEIEEGK